MPPQGIVRKSQTAWIALLALALAARIAVAFSPHAFQTDPDGYRAVAGNLLEYGVFGSGEVPTGYRPPLYPLLLVPALALGEGSRTVIGILHLAFGVATVVLTFALARRAGLGRWAWLAALVVAADPILLAQSALIMTETLAAFLAAASLVLLTSVAVRPSILRAASAGACLGLAILCRPTFLPMAVVAVGPLAWLAVRNAPGNAGGRFRAPVAAAVAYLLALAVVLAPWVQRNRAQLGSAVVATTHGGYTLLLANNPSFYEYLRSGAWGTVWPADSLNQRFAAARARSGAADELSADRLAYALAWQSIAQEPAMFAYSCLVRVGRFWSLVPHRVATEESAARCAARYGVGAWYTAVLALAAVGWLAAWRSGRGVHSQSNAPRTSPPGATTVMAWGVLLAGSFTAVHALYWTDMRMRGPVMPAVAVAAAAGAAWIGDRMRRLK